MSDKQRDAWDIEYKTRGRLWGRSTFESEVINPKCSSILDIGVGDGKNIRNITDNGLFIVGVDFSKEALKLCKNEKECHVMLVCADAVKLPFINESFDIIYLHHILGHMILKQRISLITETTRILKTGGDLFITVFGVNDVRYGKGTIIEENTFCRGNGIITHFFKIIEASDLCNTCSSLEIVKTLNPKWPMYVNNRSYIREEIRLTIRKN